VHFNGTQKIRKDTEMTHYPPDLIEKQWQVIPKILEPQARNRKHPFKRWRIPCTFQNSSL